MLDLTTLEWMELILFLELPQLEPTALPEAMDIGCTTAGDGVL
jgi:hypothetical protein